RSPALDLRHDHLRVNQSSAFYDNLAVQLDRAVAHRHVVVPACGAFSASLAVRAGREQEVAGEAPGSGAAAFGDIAIKRKRVPPALRVKAPAEMRDGIGVAVALEFFAALQPFAHQSRIDPTVDRDDMAALDLQTDRIHDIPAVGQDHDV